ncbi:hypothetical protein DK389_09405 [Methylobacterium durans]|uniref:Uncharacterized protein n=2 Tax=Methylobacterium durans TaxID=2202825 RepID=A0A2U8W3L7_9HYPH|nr:hypothetical protein DK389_09405 [Methylobacterium durans]
MLTLPASTSPSTLLFVKLGRISHGGKLLLFIISASTQDGLIAYQTRSPGTALERARSLESVQAQDVQVSDMHGRIYDPDAFDRCFVRSQATTTVGEAA